MLSYSINHKTVSSESHGTDLYMQDKKRSGDDQFHHHKTVKPHRRIYSQDFNIELSRIPDKETIKDSMLAYSRRMSEIKHLRAADRIELPLLIKATHLAHPFKGSHEDRSNRSEERKRKHAHGHGGAKSRSLPSMRLEPLLGRNDNFKLNLANLAGLQSVTSLHMNEIRHVLLGTNTLSDKSIMVLNTINSDHTETSRAAMQTVCSQEEVTANLMEQPTVNATQDIIEDGMRSPGVDAGIFTVVIADTPEVREQQKTKTAKSHLRRPRRAKRMKLVKPDLSVIQEDANEELGGAPYRLGRAGSLHKLPIPRSHIMDAIPEVEGAGLVSIESSQEKKRRDVAMLRKVNYIPKESQESRLLAIQAHVKKKLRKLPPLVPNPD